MAKMRSVQVRFPEEELRRIDRYVERGEYPSRSEFIRDAVRKAEAIRSIGTMRRLVEDEGLTEQELVEGGMEVREELFRELVGDG
ncbi:MAG: putative nickel-responsive regulator [Methanonatronarchaeales archaeon]|nr:putative nickel-responsive regulator [Methanonatronarchaeales archaeon]